VKKPSWVTVRKTADVLFYSVYALGIAARTKKDIVTHKEHEEHNPCACNDSCLVCLFA
jgi:hypothetical protein